MPSRLSFQDFQKLRAKGAGLRMNLKEQEKIKPLLANKYKSKFEERYAGYLECQKRDGLIKDWKYEELTIKLENGVRFTVDFTIYPATGIVHIIETKGHMRGDARAKLFVAAARLAKLGLPSYLVMQEGRGWTEPILIASLFHEE